MPVYPCWWNPAKYSLDGSTVPTSTVVTDLGIRVDSRLSFSDHVDHIVSKAKLRASQILRCFVSKDVRIRTRAHIMFDPCLSTTPRSGLRVPLQLLTN